MVVSWRNPPTSWLTVRSLRLPPIAPDTMLFSLQDAMLSSPRWRLQSPIISQFTLTQAYIPRNELDSAYIWVQ